MVAVALLRNYVSIDQWFAATTLLKERKKLFPEINYSHIQEKILF